MAAVASPAATPWAPNGSPTVPLLTPPFSPPGKESVLHYTFPSEADTLAYVDALKYSDLSQWRSLEEVAARAGGGSCSGAVTTSVLTALYLLGLFNLCIASPVSCCIPPASTTRIKRSSSYDGGHEAEANLPPLFESLRHNLSSLSLEKFRELPHVTTPDGDRIPVHISVVEQVRKLWDANPRLLSTVSCNSAMEAVRSSFISLSGVASGIILAYSVAQLSQCYPDHIQNDQEYPKIWFFPIPKKQGSDSSAQFTVPSLPGVIPVPGNDDPTDGCERDEVLLEDGRCASLLSAADCPYHHWILLNGDTMKGECIPRLCSEGRVYVESDELCHDINEQGMCPHNQRLFVTALGKAVCDCQDGMYQGPYGKCFSLYEPAYCQKGTVLQFHRQTQMLRCLEDGCGDVNGKLTKGDLPYAPREDGQCYQFNKVGPCSEGERFGFDSETLQPDCISLLEAGLVRPRRSYMYQHMSFPSTPGDGYPHYQVSYVILNGTTWGLEVKGVMREKRAAVHNKESKVTFLDTREIPHLLQRQHSHHKPWSQESQVEEMASGTTGEEQQFLDAASKAAEEDDRVQSPRYPLSDAITGSVLSSRDSSSSLVAGGSSGAKHLVQPTTVLETGKQKFMPKLNKMKQKTKGSARSLHRNQNQSHKRSRREMLKTVQETDTGGKKEKDASITNSKMEAFGEVTGSVFLILSGARTTEESKFTTNMVRKTPTAETTTTTRCPKSKIKRTYRKQRRRPRKGKETRRGKRRHHRRNRRIGRHRKKQLQHLKKQKKGITPRYFSTATSFLPPKGYESSYHRWTKESPVTESNNMQSCRHSNQGKLHAEETVEFTKNSKISYPTTTSPYSTMMTVTKSGTRSPSKARKHESTSDSIQNKKHLVRKVPSKEKENKSKDTATPVHVTIVPYTDDDVSGSQWETKVLFPAIEKSIRQLHVNSNQDGQYDEKANSLNQNPPQKENNTEGELQTSTSPHNGKMTTTTAKSLEVPNSLHHNPFQRKTDNTSAEKAGTPMASSLTKMVTTPGVKVHTLTKSSNVPITSEETELTNPFEGRSTTLEEPNLPDYLHHRGRRQLAGGGIIQAPLLSACKPGAKRDYNYKCRPRFIPQERSRRASSNQGSDAEMKPIPSRIKCPKGTRLDPRGQCQAASSKLG